MGGPGRNRRTTLLLAVLAGGLATACSGPEDPALQVVEEVRQAAEERDAQAVAGHLAEDFRGQGGLDRAEAVASLRRYFAAYESVRVSVYDLAVGRRTDTEAEVACRVEFSGRARAIGGLDGFLPPEAVLRFEVALRRQGEEWRVASARWQEVEPLASPPP